MKDYKTILNQVRKNYTTIAALKDKEEELVNDKRFLALETINNRTDDDRQQLDNLINEIKQVNDSYYMLELENKILKNNAQIALFESVKNDIVNIINKYAGKRYGDATKDKIYQAIKEKTGCSFYIDARFCHTFNISLLNSDGYRSYMLDTIQAGIKGNKDILIDNTIQFIDISDLELWYINSNYIEKPKQHVKQLIKLNSIAYELQEKLRAACSEFNAAAVGDIKHLTCQYDIHNRI